MNLAVDGEAPEGLSVHPKCLSSRASGTQLERELRADKGVCHIATPYRELSSGD
jgi:hypothetical protein